LSIGDIRVDQKHIQVSGRGEQMIQTLGKMTEDQGRSGPLHFLCAEAITNQHTVSVD